jgi:hypothetical protein
MARALLIAAVLLATACRRDESPPVYEEAPEPPIDPTKPHFAKNPTTKPSASAAPSSALPDSSAH